ncbi:MULTISPECIES: hypothetical protein [Sphingobium]|uniref:hypothetical protein n=1 Tax=Sphingobium TaxID=165695 RepID=UPI000DBAED38|nr:MULTISPECIES: hypothetical protein [Sphingobium]KAA9017760.1 hypothetical protein F4U94_06690 [Sphingobium limneticum]BBD00125.1 hypothetical protein YGS_C1P1380 [Sphingobium sp. YG1]
MRKILTSRPARGALLLASFTLLAAPGSSQQASGPIARYTIDAGTMSGMAAMGSGGGMGAAMSMMMGGGNKPMHELVLRLGSTRAPTGGAPAAEHFMPAGAALGASVPLVTPRIPPSEDQPIPGERPKGRLLIYWGCGATVGAGQPVIIDFAKVARGQIPPGLYMSGASIPQEWQVRVTNSKTYGDWPNAQTRKTVSASSSLLGDHRIAGNYSPDIAFNLKQDFMPPITGTARKIAGGATILSWNGLPQATGYYAWTFGAQDNGDMVWWASSATQAFGGPVWDWMSPAAVQKMIAQKIVMPPSQTSCTVPAAVTQAGGEMLMGSLYAYGPEANFAYPPRPADPKIAWKPEWIARVRYRANTMWMLNGPDMGAMMSDSGSDEGEDTPARQQQQKKKKKCGGGLGGMLGSAMGVGC